MLKLVLSEKTDASAEMQLSRYCSIAGRGNLCSAEDLG